MKIYVHAKFMFSFIRISPMLETTQTTLTCEWTNKLWYIHSAPLSIGFSRWEYWSGLLLPTPEDLPDPGIKTTSLASPALAGEFFTTVPLGKPEHYYTIHQLKWVIHETTQHLKFVWLRERNQTQKVTYYIIAFICYYGKDKSIGQKRNQWFSGIGGG